MKVLKRVLEKKMRCQEMVEGILLLQLETEMDG